MEDIQLTKNFKLSEFLKSNKADELNIENIPNEDELNNIKWMAEQLQLVRNTYGQPINISCGFRNDELNKAVGGVANSYHRKGLAVDINQGTRTKNNNLFNLLRRMINIGLPIEELGNEYNYSWIHVAFERDNPKGEIFSVK